MNYEDALRIKNKIDEMNETLSEDLLPKRFQKGFDGQDLLMEVIVGDLKGFFHINFPENKTYCSLVKDTENQEKFFKKFEELKSKQ